MQDQPSPRAIANDMRLLRGMLQQSNRFDGTLRQVLDQLFTFNENEKKLEDWLGAASAELERISDEETAHLSRIATLEAENRDLRAAALSDTDETAEPGLDGPHLVERAPTVNGVATHGREPVDALSQGMPLPFERSDAVNEQRA